MTAVRRIADCYMGESRWTGWTHPAGLAAGILHKCAVFSRVPRPKTQPGSGPAVAEKVRKFSRKRRAYSLAYVFDTCSSS